MKHYLEEISSVFAETKSSSEGLTHTEAAARLEQNGPNRLAQAKKKSIFARFLAQLADPMIIILLAAAGVSAVMAVLENAFPTDVIIILAVVVINAVLGVYQESKAENAIEALKAMSEATSRVLRGGETLRVHSSELVIGDIVLLEAGDAVPADCRIIESASLKAEEAALTGESVPSEKQSAAPLTAADGDVALGDRSNMLYMGSTVVYGRGRAVVIGTGMDTEMGKIAGVLIEAEDSRTPLQKKLSALSRVLSFLVLGICGFMFAFGVVRELLSGRGLSLEFGLDTFMLAVSLAVAAIPEGLAAVVTVVLSMGVTKMAKNNAIIRRLTAVETLGCAGIICSDKTGTLTQNKMTVTDFVSDDQSLLATGLALCTDAEINAEGKVDGEPTEAALVAYGATLGLIKGELAAKMPRIGEAPFDSERKMMTTVHAVEAGAVQFTKGAPDEVISRCSYIYKEGRVVEMTEADRAAAVKANKDFADRALRVLALGFKKLDAAPEDLSPAVLERDMIYVGLVGMIDPVRPEVVGAVKQCVEAGIRPIMITGDHRDTAAAIAMELGIITNPSEAITGADIDAMGDSFEGRITEFSVYARVRPEHKVRIVNAWRALGMVTAMTGDGVNDAPSIKSADIGIGMGITGTDVTKNVADMVLADDNFATIVTAVAEGRRIYDNIRKAINFLLASNLSEVVAIFAASLLGFTVLKPVHLLWINLVTDTFPALALGTEAAEADVMKRKPRDANDGVFADGLGFAVAYQGVVIALITLAAYFIGHYMESGVFEIAQSSHGMTMAFLTMSLCEVFHSLNMRSMRSSSVAMALKGGHNMLLYGSALLSLVLTTAVLFVPFLAKAFGFESISLAEYAVSIGLALCVIPIVEAVKALTRALSKK